MPSVAESEQVCAALRTMLRRVDDLRAWWKKACVMRGEVGTADLIELSLHVQRLGAAWQAGCFALAALDRARAAEG